MSIRMLRLETEQSSFADLYAVREAILAAAREAEAADRVDDLVVELRGTWYALEEPLVLSTADNPELCHVRITLKGKGSERPRIHSFRRVEGRCFTPVEGTPYYAYQLPKSEDGSYPLFRNLFLNTRSIPSARSAVWWNPDDLSSEERKGEVHRTGFFAPLAVAKQVADAPLGATELMMYVEWEFVILHATGADLSDTCEIAGETYARILIDEEEMDAFCRDCHPELNTRRRETFIQNAPAFLTEPGTYAYDYKNGVVYVVPEKDTPMAHSFVQYPTAENYLILEGLSDMTVEGIEFTGTTSRYACLHPYHSGQANTVKHTGRLQCAAILTRGAERFTVRGCRFTDLGTNGIQMTGCTKRATVADCVFQNMAMNALSIGNPSWVWSEPANRNYALTVKNNYFAHVGYEYPSSPCLYIGMVDGLKILRNTFEGCAYSAMSVGWGWSRVYYEAGEACNVRDAEIAYNYIHNFMDVLRDGGAIYVLGGNCNIENTDRFNFMHHNYARLDVRRDHSKFGYYCDGSSTNWDLSDSVMINCARPLFSQYVIPGAFTYHNHFTRVYSTTPYERVIEAPERDIVFTDYFTVPEGEDALYEKHPEAKAIRDGAGCTLTV